MKNFFTLIAGMLLVSSGAFAQTKWTNVTPNGDFEGTQDPKWSSFWCHDWRKNVEFDAESGQKYDNDDPENGQFQGFAEVVVDPANPNNHCAHVYVRSAAEAAEAGNAVMADGNLAGWDTQFFIYAKVDEAIPAGKMVRFSMKVKADTIAKAGTQAHAFPGNYNHWAMVGDVNFTTEWATFTWEGILSSDQAPADKGFLSIALNLADTKTGYDAYFDDIKLEIKDQGEPEPFAGWLNFLRKGTLSADKIQNYTTFTSRDGITANAPGDEKDQPARIVNDPDDGQPAMVVTTVAYNYHSIDSIKPIYEVDEVTGDTLIDGDTGEPIQKIDDETGEPAWETQENNWCIVAPGDTIKQIDDWTTQFFVTIPHKFVTNQKYKLVFSVRADKPTTLDTQAHIMPGGYVHYNFCGSIDVTEDWHTYTFGTDDQEDEENAAKIASECNGCQTIAFNCNKTKDDGSENNIYFRFEEFSFNKADVTDSERVLGSESVTLPLGDAKDSEVTGKIDMNEGFKVLELSDVAAVAANNVLLKDVEVDPEDQSEEEVFDIVQLTSGAFINAKGNNTEDTENVIVLEATDESADGVMAIKVTNWDIQVEEGKNVETKLVLENGDWRYLYNITFVSEETYTGINEMTTAPKANVIYDLMGRQLTKVAKGLYIMNGKKVLVK
ncbi:hypothetical protein [Prevotella sp. E2-28]|uniref:hypothetical protein n=1 Tax=Prevotella sp. E2-28 TaxID=2913620 RepID=UPI001EDC8954|nr:hypothetical protein [Prevotella sp. E2-28]UKK54096.1 hypothetical protein L6465_02185 [Prevotella sp. E2-28]